MTDPRQFYTEVVPRQFNASLDAQAALGEAGRRVYEEMCAVDGTILVRVEGEEFFLDIEAGRMRASAQPKHPPFMRLIQDRPDFEILALESGGSPLALLGWLSGLGGEMKLTRTRMLNLSFVKGTVLFEVEGADGFRLITHFGDGIETDPPNASIRVSPESYRELRAGGIDPPTAFLDGKIRVEGDVQLSMQLALAAVAPD